ncbi:MAG: hypothetical protein WAV41_02350 [Microgenomates group bacterium]
MTHVDITSSNLSDRLSLDTTTPNLPFPVSQVEVFAGFARVTFSPEATVFSASEHRNPDNSVNLSAGCSLYATILPDISLRVQIS